MTSFTPHILVAEADSAVLTAASRILQLNGYLVVSCSDGETALQLFRELTPSLLVIALQLPQLSGIELCRRIRLASDVPILVLVAASEESEAAEAIAAGADEYVRKPFDTPDFLTRVQSALSRSRPAQSGARRLSNGVITLDEDLHQVLVDNRQVSLSKTEFALLAFLLRSPGQVRTHDQILVGVWGPSFAGSYHLLRVSMSRLRQKLEPEASGQIETLPRVGYRLRAQ